MCAFRNADEAPASVSSEVLTASESVAESSELCSVSSASISGSGKDGR